MSRSNSNAFAQRIEKERSLKQLGTIRVRLGALLFPHSKRTKELKKANIDRLKRLFRVEGGCRPDDLANRIPAVIDESQLQQYLNESEISANRVSDNPARNFPQVEFPSDFRLECLRGRHRVEAARQVLPECDQWWTVDLYPASISLELKSTLIEEYTNEIKPDDGEFYYKIREYQGYFGQKNPYFEKRWWARLAAISTSSNKKERLEQLFRHVQFAPAFDAFRHIPALYGGMRLSTLNKMISMKCHEEILTALSFTRNFYYDVFDQDESKLRQLTRSDIEALQLTAPGACEQDFSNLDGLVKSGKVLGAFDADERERIWEKIRLSTTDCLVPSLYAFFENLKYLKGPADCMKRLIQQRRGWTIQSALWDAFSDPGLSTRRCLIQDSKNTLSFIQADTAGRFDMSYRQLWLNAIRDYRDMPKKIRQKLAQPKNGDANEKVLYDFALLADRLGFETQEIHDILEQNPDKEIAHRLLRTARNPQEYMYKDIDGCISRVVDIIREAELLKDGEDDRDDENMPDVGTLLPETPPNRCGVLNDADQLRDKSSMYLTKLHQPITREASLSSFFIQRSVYFFFFGKDSTLYFDIDAEAGDDSLHPSGEKATRSGSPNPEAMPTPVEISQQHIEPELQAPQATHPEPLTSSKTPEPRTSIHASSMEQRENEAKLKHLEEELEKKAGEIAEAQKQAETLREEVDSLKSQAAEQSKNQALELQMAISQNVHIGFFHQNQNRWVLAHELYVDPRDPSRVQKKCEDYLKQGIGVFDLNKRQVTPKNCYETVMSNGSRIVLLFPDWRVGHKRKFQYFANNEKNQVDVSYLDAGTKRLREPPAESSQVNSGGQIVIRKTPAPIGD